MSAPAQAEGAPLPNIGTLQVEGTPIEVRGGIKLRRTHARHSRRVTPNDRHGAAERKRPSPF
jgi:hypothetical protein